MNRCQPGVFGRVAASTPGYQLTSLRPMVIVFTGDEVYAQGLGG